jgi:uncharacterized protein (DUF697 family)
MNDYSEGYDDRLVTSRERLREAKERLREAEEEVRRFARDIDEYEDERPLTPEERLREAEHKVRFYRNVAIGLGFVPLPVVDLVAVTGVQMAMLHSICKVYRCRFHASRAKRLIGSLVGGFAAPTLGMAAASIVKSIPVIGLPAAFLASPAAAGASTYAIGYVFIQEFESGGNMLTLDPKKRAKYYAQMYRKGERLARHQKDGQTAETSVADVDRTPSYTATTSPATTSTSTKSK